MCPSTCILLIPGTLHAGSVQPISTGSIYLGTALSHPHLLSSISLLLPHSSSELHHEPVSIVVVDCSSTLVSFTAATFACVVGAAIGAWPFSSRSMRVVRRTSLLCRRLFLCYLSCFLCLVASVFTPFSRAAWVQRELCVKETVDGGTQTRMR